MTKYEETYIQENDKYLFTGDFIKTIERNSAEGTIAFTYIIGGQYYRTIDGDFVEYLENTGIEYREIYPFSIKKVTKTIDGVNIDLYYEDIDFSSKEISIYNEDYNLYRNAITSNINRMNIGDTWNDKEAIQSPIFKSDILMGINDKPKHDINVEINRGGISIKEKHFKLGECNTFADLENYGNNFFGLN